MDPKVTTQLVKAVKQFIVAIFLLFGEAGVRLIKELVEEWLETRSKKASATKTRARRKKP